jgi:hypothetical protein
MLAQRLDPVEAFRQKAATGSPVYRKKLRTRGLSIHARFVERAMEVFPGAVMLENIPQAAAFHSESQECQ